MQLVTALVTPLNENGVDYEAFGKLIDWQIEEGIDALVIAGTSGEGSTLIIHGRGMGIGCYIYNVKR